MEGRIIFLNLFQLTEAKAAKEANLKVVLLERPGNSPFSDDDRAEFTIASSFADISLETVALGKRKYQENVIEEAEVNENI